MRDGRGDSFGPRKKGWLDKGNFGRDGEEGLRIGLAGKEL